MGLGIYAAYGSRPAGVKNDLFFVYMSKNRVAGN